MTNAVLRWTVGYLTNANISLMPHCLLSLVIRLKNSCLFLELIRGKLKFNVSLYTFLYYSLKKLVFISRTCNM